jgi:hypothetical protein
MSSLTFGNIPARMDNPGFWGMGQYCSGLVNVNDQCPGGSPFTYCPQFPVLGVDTVTGARYVLGGYYVPTGDYTGYYFIVNETVVTGGGALLFDWQGILQTYGNWPTAKLDTMPWPARTAAWLAWDDSIAGSTGSDTLVGYGGNDAIRGRGGNDVIDGGVGVDTAIFAGRSTDYRLLSYGGAVAVLPVSATSGAYAADGTDQLLNVESVRFDGDGVVAAVDSASPFQALQYIASYWDLMQAFGATGAAGFNHYVVAGFAEGRTVTFHGLEYIASYGDLANAFGANADAGAGHYIQAGRFEGRTVSFDGFEYIASYGDLIKAFGASADAGAGHYIQAGRFEGRHVTFDGLEYIASYGDLIKALGANADAGAKHYIGPGHTEGRHVTFDGLEYIASYADLIKAFHTQVAATADPDIGANHYIAAGYAEHRAADHFDAAQYLANYTDLQAAFGHNTEAATLHYITNGYFEHRTDHAP